MSTALETIDFYWGSFVFICYTMKLFKLQVT